MLNKKAKGQGMIEYVTVFSLVIFIVILIIISVIPVFQKLLIPLTGG